MKALYEKEYFKLGGDYARYDGSKIQIKSKAKIEEYFKNRKITIVDDSDSDEVKTKSFYDVWSHDPNMREYNEVVFDCNIKNVKPNQFNLFDGFDVEKLDHVKKTPDLKKKLNLIEEHIKSLCNYNMEHVALIKWFLAHMLKKPHILPPICLVFISKEGVGKDLFYELMENMLGEKYTFNVDKLEGVVGKFNSIFGGKILGCINETDPQDSMQRRDSIKYVTTAKKVYIEKKHKDPVKSPNYCRLVFFANRLLAFPVEKGSRRPYIMYSSEKYLPENIGAKANKLYFDNLANAIQDKNVQRLFYEELMKIDVENFNFKETEKSDLQKILEESAKPPLAEFLAEIVTDHKNDLFYTVKTVELLSQYSKFLNAHNMKFECTQKSFNADLCHTFKVQKYESNGRAKFKLDIKVITEILKTKFNCLNEENNMFVKNNETKDEDDEEPEKLEKYIDPNDKAEYVRAEVFTNLENEFNELNEYFMEENKYTKKLENDYYKLEDNYLKIEEKNKKLIEQLKEIKELLKIDKETDESTKNRVNDLLKVLDN